MVTLMLCLVLLRELNFHERRQLLKTEPIIKREPPTNLPFYRHYTGQLLLIYVLFVKIHIPDLQPSIVNIVKLPVCRMFVCCRIWL